MALPVVPFIIGAAAGSVVTYLYKDKAARDRWVESAEGWYAGLASLWRREKPLQEVAEEAGELAEQAAETVEEAVEAVQETAEEAVETVSTETEPRVTESESPSVH